MSVYVIGDLHLSFGENKPMEIFGSNWKNHSEKIKEDWEKNVEEEDTVILAGDFSWAMHLKDTYKDFEYLNNLPGKKILLKGNHDYWWTTVTSMKKYLVENNIKNIEFLYNNSYLLENKIIVGTRGWSLLDTENSEKMINREILRLELSIKDGLEKYGEDKEIITIMHYPPISNLSMKNEYTYKSEFVDLMNKYNIKKCFYGHLHGPSHKDAINEVKCNIDFKLISADYLDFKLLKIIDNEGKLC